MYTVMFSHVITNKPIRSLFRILPSSIVLKLQTNGYQAIVYCCVTTSGSFKKHLTSETEV